MAQGDSWLDCTAAKLNLGVQSLLRLLMVNDGDDNPAVRVYSVNSSFSISSPANSEVSQELVTGATLATLVTNLQTWKTNNASKKIIRITPATGLDGSVGIIVEYIS